MISRNLDKARDAYLKGDTGASAAAHGGDGSPEPHNTGSGKYLKSIVYGGLDGIITTFAVVSGVAGASLDAAVILILGCANLFADGIAMAFGDFLSTRAENEYHGREREREEWEFDNYLEGEKKELVEIYEQKGIDSDDARTIVDILAKNKDAMVDIMMVEELGILKSDESPVGNAVATLVSFVVFGSVPLLIYVIQKIVPLEISPLPWAVGLTGMTLFALGTLKTRFTGRSWVLSGLEMLIVGGVAALAAYFIGAALEGLAA